MKVKAITPAGKADVYNMEVEGTHDFVLSNGVVAHNCYDETRYFLMSRPVKPLIKELHDFLKDVALNRQKAMQINEINAY